MPELDGLETTRIIRRDEASEGSHTPIIAVTANATPQHRAACQQAGMDDCVSKPVRLKELGAVLRRWLPIPATAPATSPSRLPGNGAFDQRPAVAGDAAVYALPLAAELAVDASTLATMHDLADTIGPGEFADLLDAFLATAEIRLAALTAASALADRRQLVQAAHSLRGSSASFGAYRLAALCADLEQASAAADQARLAELTQQVGAEYQHVRQAIMEARGGSA